MNKDHIFLICSTIIIVTPLICVTIIAVMT